MTERSFLLKQPEVRGILDGRISQIRRPVKEDIPHRANFERMTAPGVAGLCMDWHEKGAPCRVEREIKCPYGKPGDILIGKETWWIGEYNFAPDAVDPPEPTEPALFYRADGERSVGWRPSVHMPKWASRIKLEITDVEFSWAQEISEEDAVLYCGINYFSDADMTLGVPTWAFRSYYSEISGPDCWERNPPVWVMGVRRV